MWRDAATDPTAVMLRKIGFTVFHSHSTVLELMLLLGAIGLVLFLLVYVSAVVGRDQSARPRLGTGAAGHS